MKVRYREAGVDDLPRLIDLGFNFVASTTYSDMIKLNRAVLQENMRMLITGPSGAILAAEVDNVIVGMLGLATYLHLYTGEKVAAELFWWVEPEYRGVIGLRLLRLGERWAQGKNCELLQMIAPNAEIEKLYDRLGYDRVEVSYQRYLSDRSIQ